MMGSFDIKLNTGPTKNHPSKFFAALPNVTFKLSPYAYQYKLIKPTVDLLILLINHLQLYGHFLSKMLRMEIRNGVRNFLWKNINAVLS